MYRKLRWKSVKTFSYSGIYFSNIFFWHHKYSIWSIHFQSCSVNALELMLQLSSCLASNDGMYLLRLSLILLLVFCLVLTAIGGIVPSRSSWLRVGCSGCSRRSDVSGMSVLYVLQMHHELLPMFYYRGGVQKVRTYGDIKCMNTVFW